jgi:AcrR family transcriptional regulator
MAEAQTGSSRRIRDPQRGQRILQASAELFYERGFHAVTVDEIGERAGATGAAIYRHFSGKEEILSTLFDEAQDRYLLAVPDAHGDPFEELDTLVDRNLALTLENRELASIWAREDRALSQPYLRRLKRRERQYIDRWVECLARCFPERDHADLAAAARVAIGTMVALAATPSTHAIDEREIAMVRGMVGAALRSLAEVEAASA